MWSLHPCAQHPPTYCSLPDYLKAQHTVCIAAQRRGKTTAFLLIMSYFTADYKKQKKTEWCFKIVSLLSVLLSLAIIEGLKRDRKATETVSTAVCLMSCVAKAKLAMPIQCNVFYKAMGKGRLCQVYFFCGRFALFSLMIQTRGPV